MGPRRTHQKTKTGCYSCKKRHIKCDELGPPCANCKVRGIECTPSSSSDAARSTLAPTSESISITTTKVGADSPIDSAQTTESRLLEIELIHTWTIKTHRDISLVADDQEFWQTTVPQEAISHDFLLDAILSITSLHVAIATSPERSKKYHTAALQYQNRAIADFKAAAPAIKSSNHQALFAFSMIVLALGFAVPRHSPQDQSNRSIFAQLKTAFGLLQGTSIIYRTSMAWLKDSPFATIPQKYRSKKPASILEGEVGEAFRQLKAINDAEYTAKSSKSSSPPADLVIWHECNLKALKWLQECFVPDPDEGTLRCLTWLATLEPEFMRAIEDAEPFALLVTMYWAVSLHRCGEERWWARSSGKILITELCQALGSRKADWAVQINWICNQVGLPGIV